MRSVLTIILASLAFSFASCNTGSDNNNQVQESQEQDTLRNNAIQDAEQLLGNDSLNHSDSLQGADSINAPKNQ
jgi:hypothetical protein